MTADVSPDPCSLNTLEHDDPGNEALAVGATITPVIVYRSSRRTLIPPPAPNGLYAQKWPFTFSNAAPEICPNDPIDFTSTKPQVALLRACDNGAVFAADSRRAFFYPGHRDDLLRSA